MGRRRKNGYNDMPSQYGRVRNKSIVRLYDLHNAVFTPEMWCSRGHDTPLFQELVARARNEDGGFDFGKDKAWLICHYLNSDDVMKVLKCNRRTALDYLQVLRDLVRPYCQDP